MRARRAVTTATPPVWPSRFARAARRFPHGVPTAYNLRLEERCSPPGCTSRIDMSVPTSRKQTATPSKKPPRLATRSGDQRDLEAPTAARSKPLPARLEPQLATLVRQAPEGDQWLSEIKFDGYRMFCRVQRDGIRFSSRNHLDWTERLKSLATAVGRLGLENTILDGEVVTVEPDGTTSFQSLLERISRKPRRSANLLRVLRAVSGRLRFDAIPADPAEANPIQVARWPEGSVAV